MENIMVSKLLNFVNAGGNTVYNPTVPFGFDGGEWIGARLEPFDEELSSRVVFAERRDDNWVIDEGVCSLGLQDPAHAEVGKRVVVAGVRVWEEDGNVKWKQDFYQGDSVRDLEYFASGPVGMKDVRLVDLGDRVGVFTRPQGKVGGKGKIGYFEVGGVDELVRLGEGDWYDAKILGGMFGDGFWGGANQVVRLSGNEVGVVGHVACEGFDCFGSRVKKYSGMAFRFDGKTGNFSWPKVIAERRDFPYAVSKRSPELDDVVFSSGVDGRGNYYCGLGDFCCGVKKVGRLG